MSCRGRITSIGSIFALVLLTGLVGRPLRASDTRALGHLSIESNPSGAEVDVDGQYAGRTPLRALPVVEGHHRIRVALAGYLENRRVVLVDARTPTAVRVPLTYSAIQSAGDGLKIVVIEGEDAVNVVRQKTAVAPVVEVRDRNDQPVAGATVRFAIHAGKATFGGPKALTLTTNTAGRAAVTTLTPTGSGALQITATAAFQGQTAAVTIAQTNVMTAAAAAGGAGAGAGAGGAGVGSGGGLSTTTVATVAGAAVGGAVAVRQLTKTSTPTTTGYTGDYAVNFTMVFGPTCAFTANHVGTITLTIKNDNGSISGNFDTQGTSTVLAVNGCAPPPAGPSVGSSVSEQYHFAVTGSAGSFGGNVQNVAGAVSSALVFAGSVNGSAVTGTLTFTDRNQGTVSPVIASSTTSVTLH